MYENILRERLTSLYKDLTCTNDEAVSLMSFMNNSFDDKVTVINDIYYHEHAPVRVLSTEFTGTGGSYDIEEELIKISEGYDRFLKQIGLRTSNVLSKHTHALDLFLNLLSLPEPYSRILYLRFFKGCSIDEVSKSMFISKTSCYRKQEKGIRLLYERLNSLEGETV